MHSWGNQDLNEALVPEEEEEEGQGEEEEDDDDNNNDGDDDSLKIEAPVLCAVHWGIRNRGCARFLES